MLQVKMTPSKQSKAAGLESLAELSKLSATSAGTLRNWHKFQPKKFKCMLAGAVQLKKEELK